MWLSRKNRRRLILGVTVLFLAMNIVAFFHAYKFTHFTKEPVIKTEDPTKLSWMQRISTLVFGIDNPRPHNGVLPSHTYQTVVLKGERQLEGWLIPTDSAKGTVILFHGYSGAKSNMLDKAAQFRQLGYRTFLVDFRGSGGSEGNQTTIGFHEAKDVKLCMEHIQKMGEKHIYLFGSSMGAAAIMKAMNDYSLQPLGIILECPFGTMYQTTCARFHNMNVPTFPMASLLVFWGGVQNNFWAFSHNPDKYAKAIRCPVLLLYGEKDNKVSRAETDAIYANLQGPKTLKTYPLAGHDNYLKQYKPQWISDVTGFLTNLNPN